MSPVALKLVGILLCLMGEGPTGSKHTFEIEKAGTEFCWILKDSDGAVLATSGTNFATQKAAVEAVSLLQAQSRKRYQTEEEGLCWVQIYTDPDHGYRWQRIWENPKTKQKVIQAVSAPTFKTLAEAEAAAMTSSKVIANAKLLEAKK